MQIETVTFDTHTQVCDMSHIKSEATRTTGTRTRTRTATTGSGNIAKCQRHNKQKHTENH